MKNEREIQLMKIAIEEHIRNDLIEMILALIATLMLFTLYDFTGKIITIYGAGFATAWWLYCIIDLYYTQYKIWKIKDVRKIFKMIYGW